MIHASSLLNRRFHASSPEDLLILAERLGLNCFEVENCRGRDRVTMVGRDGWDIRDAKSARWRPFLASQVRPMRAPRSAMRLAGMGV
jgi:hypothetical protein